MTRSKLPTRPSSTPASAARPAIRCPRRHCSPRGSRPPTLPSASAHLSEVTGQPLDAEPAGYTDPVWSNLGAGFRDVSGRTTALAVDGDTYYAGTADGGVWKSGNAGRTWHSIWDGQDTLSIGALLVTSDHALWVGTGEANTSSDSYLGTGVYRSTDGGRTFTRVGGNQLIDRTSFRLVDDGAGHVYAATNQGLYRHSSRTVSRQLDVGAQA